ncbi:virulence factor Mce family protein [Nocardia amikacinitolerans]|uniref:Virulence factor Mce family protein n=1 Tax=Nocardia amikacinitolerans TaxID=756689 RepID=A0A285LR18_9NOCA|nr:MCE family protein [Nocardia amikacinitolerans]MCP2276681.1 virulence factor Mce family protein [Nocardia amikacinitolerans]MCP2294938.1 virulence factor Mce family protein [Nocardia amikacinitolerans]SNY87368.1 virulence factor Mce family protein [Nocardia amikacinitolerans]
MIIDPSGRGPTMRQLLIAGVCGLIVFALVLGFLMARYTGYFVPKVNVVAQLTTTGDGLPSEADVKFRGVLVGAVDEVEVAAKGELQKVQIELKPEYAGDIPSNVTARVVPSNLFAVTSIELVFNGPSDTYLKEGSVIEEDRSKGTIALQDTLTTVRNILEKIDPVQFGRVLGTLSQALDGSGRMPGSTIERLDRWVLAVDESIPDLGVFLNDFSSSFRALNESAPELLDVLGSSVQTASTIAERRDELVALITGTSGTVDRVNDLFARNPNVGKEVTVGTSDLFGALTADPSAITRTLLNLSESVRAMNTTFRWGPQQQQIWNAGITLTPYKPYTVADCPRYDEMAGPSCATAPEVNELPPLPENLRPRALESAAGLPPVVPMPGLPLIPGVTMPDPGRVVADLQGTAQQPFAGTPLEGLFPVLPGLPGLLPPAPAPAAAPADAPAAGRPISYQGDAAIEKLLGRKPTTAEYLLLSPILKGGTMEVSEGGAR